MLSKGSYDGLVRRAALLGLLGLAGCGFTPVYGPDGSAAQLRGTIDFAEPVTVADYNLRRRLIERLGDTVEGRYTLSATLSEVPTPATITSDGDTTRFNIVGTADWALVDASGGIVKSGKVETFTSYSATGSTVATQSARIDASQRLAIGLADLIIARLLISAPELAR